MCQNFNTVTAFDGTTYGYWKARMRFFLKSIDYWSIVETSCTKPTDATPELVTEKNVQLSNDKALHALCQVLSSSKFKQHMNPRNSMVSWENHLGCKTHP
jgi:hypothetical protein